MGTGILHSLPGKVLTMDQHKQWIDKFKDYINSLPEGPYIEINPEEDDQQHL
jgi:hypothetical protein